MLAATASKNLLCNYCIIVLFLPPKPTNPSLVGLKSDPNHALPGRESSPREISLTWPPERIFKLRHVMSEISSAFRQLRALMASQAGGSKFSSKFFDQFNGNLQGAALKATRHALSLPSDLAFHRSMDQELAQDLDSFSARILSITNDLLAFVSTADSTQSTRAKEKLKLENQDDVVDSFQSLVVDTMDQLLERAVGDTHYERWLC